jgi:hypothetical protein
MNDDTKLTRADALKKVVVLPALAALLTVESRGLAFAADNKSQFHYQDKPGKHGQKCSGCRFFRKPSSCAIVTGKISPNGWCIAWAKR